MSWLFLIWIIAIWFSVIELSTLDWNSINKHIAYRREHCRPAPEYSEHAEICDFDYSTLPMKDSR